MRTLVQFIAVVTATALHSAVLVDATLGADPEADALLRQWRSALGDAPRMSVKFRVVQRDYTFGRKNEGVGEYYRDGTGQWALTIADNADAFAGPVSAMTCANSTNFSHSISLAIISRKDEIFVGVGTQLPSLERYPLPLLPIAGADASPPTLGSWLSYSIQRSLMAPYALPLFIVDGPDCDSLTLELHRNNQGKRLLRFSAPSKSGSQNFLSQSFRSLDFAFRSEHVLPYAIRTVDAAGIVERRTYVDEIKVNADSEIPINAFDRPSNVFQPLIPKVSRQ